MKKKLIVLGMSAIMALTMVSPLTTQKVEAHNSSGYPSEISLPHVMLNASTQIIHENHAKEVIQTTYNKYSACYKIYRCSCGGQYTYWID